MHAICDLIASENGDIASKASNVVVKVNDTLQQYSIIAI